MAEESDSRRASSARRPRTDLARRRPHSQPDRLLTVSRRNSSGPGKMEGAGEEVCRPSEEKSVRVFKRREIGTCNEDKSKNGRNGGKTNGKSKAGSEEKPPDAKRRRQRLVLEGSDEDSEPSEKNGNGSKDSSSPSKRAESKPVAKAAPEGVGLRKSSRVVKRRTFDDEIDFDEVIKRRRRPPQQDSAKEAAAKQVDENTDSADDDHPRKKPRRGSIQELQSASEKPKQRGGSVVTQENAVPREKPLTARQRAMQAKDSGILEQPSTSGRDEAQKVDSPSDSVDSKEKATVPLTARQRSLQACKDGDGNFGLIEFPEGLNHTDRRRKAKLTDEEKLAKKAEAASKRKQQVEKAAKEIQASAIQKILNQDSNRKKREEKIQKQKQELAEEKKAAELEVATNSVRWIMGPSGTTVSWAQDEFPALFSSGPIRYPPPREKCAACDNAYKYRDSKSNLPLCSLQCYKAVQQPLKPALEVSPAQ
ncbi:uncharacterized protein DDB_G0286299 isoform X1 [Selaginella moellendorffii]|uniref:uncharacterized protein DDB_G0286299 isoform X1 n=1 Tax=Selaginella moellendorffii TaxID=88036 RepID=UPI000D1C732B|nr:uncharacterized protein DDB_G0286299 isoform X1 [Selaginella moellendorffii]XP_024515554.1 uncharacterized protein DDB_G0286299 isoform X1 [Selaginella moellendorffii]|eukprot:XP_024515553.1 uncharacterized protein DDB_G0286299 isoform X1 [Selaginella moellendorffii]